MTPKQLHLRLMKDKSQITLSQQVPTSATTAYFHHHSSKLYLWNQVTYIPTKSTKTSRKNGNTRSNATTISKGRAPINPQKAITQIKIRVNNSGSHHQILANGAKVITGTTNAPSGHSISKNAIITCHSQNLLMIQKTMHRMMKGAHI